MEGLGSIFSRFSCVFGHLGPELAKNLSSRTTPISNAILLSRFAASGRDLTKWVGGGVPPPGAFNGICLENQLFLSFFWINLFRDAASDVAETLSNTNFGCRNAFRPLSDGFGRFRTVFGSFWTVSDRFRTVWDRFQMLSNRFGRLYS